MAKRPKENRELRIGMHAHVACQDFTALTNFLFLEDHGTVRFLSILISPAFFKVGIAPLILAGIEEINISSRSLINS